MTFEIELTEDGASTSLSAGYGGSGSRGWTSQILATPSCRYDLGATIS